MQGIQTTKITKSIFIFTSRQFGRLYSTYKGKESQQIINQNEDKFIENNLTSLENVTNKNTKEITKLERYSLKSGIESTIFNHKKPPKSKRLKPSEKQELDLSIPEDREYFIDKFITPNLNKLKDNRNKPLFEDELITQRIQKRKDARRIELNFPLISSIQSQGINLPNVEREKDLQKVEDCSNTKLTDLISGNNIRITDKKEMICVPGTKPINALAEYGNDLSYHIFEYSPISSEDTLQIYEHLFQNIPHSNLPLDPKLLGSLTKIKIPQGKEDFYEMTKEFLNLVFSFYTPDHFNAIKMFQINIDQLMVLIQNKNFIKYSGRKVVEALTFIEKSRSLVFYNRPEIITPLMTLISKNNLTQLPPSYIASLFTIIAKMKLLNPDIWFTLIAHFLRNLNIFGVQEITSILYSLRNGEKQNPQIFSFSDIYTELEPVILLQFSQLELSSRLNIPKLLATTLLSYGKTQNGSVEFYTAMEPIILKYSFLFNTQELSNIVFSYARAENAETHILENLKAVIIELINKAKPMEICNIAIAYNIAGTLQGNLIYRILAEFIANHEKYKIIDLVSLHQIFCGLDYKDINNSEKYLEYMNKSLLCLLNNAEGPQLNILFLSTQGLTKEVLGLMKQRVNFLLKGGRSVRTLKRQDVRGIYEGARSLEYKGEYNLFAERIRRYMDKKGYQAIHI